ncbi:C25 family cysteine peptidase [Paraflavisolibacter sp. H34]|uniref:putative type IX secretion system sortase PorU2 n=1 Tax=Huijunlia imazamoxiresistens TaxID=3127457 RepID=UPI00301A1427
MKKVLILLLTMWAFAASAQVFNNEWIDFSKTYYKFKVAKTGLHRISQATLNTAGLGSVPAEQFQLWRHGQEIPLYTSSATGALSSAGYIEFWGELNDGKPDKQLYKQPEFQLNDKWSLLTDTAVYFLTVNPTGANRRLAETPNTISGTPTPEPYFMHTVGQYYKARLNPGRGVVIDGQPLYSSWYDEGEGYTSTEIGSNASLSQSFTNLQPYTAGPAATLRVSVSGNAWRRRNFRATAYSDSITGGRVDSFNAVTQTGSFAASKLTATAAIQVTNLCNTTGCPSDRMVVHKIELTYPRLFNFGGQTNFEFTLPASTGTKYLEITNFSLQSTTPVLYDLTNGRRYVAVLTGSTVKVLLQPSATERRLVLVNQAATNITAVDGLVSRSFTNYAQAANQGDYLIITNGALTSGGSAVDDYKAYRSSAAGGSYRAQVYLIDELVDQFGFGIKMTPLAVRNFIWYARQRFSQAPKHVFLLGKGLHYTDQRTYEANANLPLLHLVPTFGYPASDFLLSAEHGSAVPQTPIGRLSVINQTEIAEYLKKVKEQEANQQALSPKVEDRAWTKNVVHTIGVSEPSLLGLIQSYMNYYSSVVTDTLYGGKVTTFSRTSSGTISQLTSKKFDSLMTEGISFITYFGHSATGTLDFNLENPEVYKNVGKYPMFVALGCNAGNLYSFDTKRLVAREALSEKYVLAPGKGMIGFVASTSFGIVNYFNIWGTGFYQALARTDYGKTIGELMKVSAARHLVLDNDFYSQAIVSQLQLNGDPAMKLNTHEKVDYALTDPMVEINPTFISVAENSFRVKARWTNLGKTTNRKMVVEFKREFPDRSVRVVHRETLDSRHFEDSVVVDLPIDALRDKGTNKLTITVDADNQVDEFFESNNSVTKEFVIFEDEARPVYPYNFSIVGQPNPHFFASTADPFSRSKEYRLEIDTTELFNSSLKVSQSLSSSGGLLEFSPTLSLRDNTVYFWRVGTVPATGSIKWTNSSFLYLAGGQPGFNLSHLYQQFKTTPELLSLDSTSRRWTFDPVSNNLFIRNAVWGTATTQEGDLVVNVNNASYIRNTCNYGWIFNVFDKTTFKPWRNAVSGGQGLYGSLPPTCGESRMYNFEFFNDTAGRRKALNFLRQVPDGFYVVVRNQPYSAVNSNQYVSNWQADANIYGANNTLYSELKKNNVTIIDSFYRPRAFAAVFSKNNPQFAPRQGATEGLNDKLTLSADPLSSGSSGTVASPVFGPAKAWKQFSWEGTSLEANSTDIARVTIEGIDNNGNTSTLLNNIDRSQGTVDLSSIDAAEFPFLRLRMTSIDSANFTPYQLKYWRLAYDPAPEGAVAPNLYFRMKDTLAPGEPIELKLAFKNVSPTRFDSLLVKAVVTDRNNVEHVVPVERTRPLPGGDTLTLTLNVDTRELTDANSLYVDFNPDNDQPEQHHFNNFIFRNFLVRGDNQSPILDVTFDNVHILNRDIVSAKPHIVIRLKDESEKLLLSDTALMTVKVRYPDGHLQTFAYDNDTLQFQPATQSADNTATLSFRPSFSEDSGEGEYELIVSGRDVSGNEAGESDYRVAFQVINKPMISNLLNYPNPFTTSTAFVFTLTGSEVPQNMRIQVLTVTGKVVREITKEELGPLHIGRNITEFKWDGTDQYGQRLANGVYLYRVLTNLNGKSLEKLTTTDGKNADNTDKYFNKGYGKMYLMR